MYNEHDRCEIDIFSRMQMIYYHELEYQNLHIKQSSANMVYFQNLHIQVFLSRPGKYSIINVYYVFTIDLLISICWLINNHKQKTYNYHYLAHLLLDKLGRFWPPADLQYIYTLSYGATIIIHFAQPQSWMYIQEKKTRDQERCC